MNQFMQEQWSMFEGIAKQRMELLDSLSDSDLMFNPGGQNITLGALCREMGEIEYSYIQSLKTFKQDWSYRNTEPGLETSVSKLKTWYETLDSNLEETVSALSEEDFKKTVDRGFQMPVEIQLQAYMQALLIILGKLSIYLRAMNKPLPGNMEAWIG